MDYATLGGFIFLGLALAGVYFYFKSSDVADLQASAEKLRDRLETKIEQLEDKIAEKFKL